MAGFAKSLRLRLILLAGFLMAVALTVTGIALSTMFSRHLERRVGQELNTHIAQLAGAVRFSPDGNMTLSRQPADPRFNQVFAGLYWQIIDLSSGERMRSRSLWDAQLDFPDDELEPGVVHVHDITGPTGRPLLAHEQLMVVDEAGEERRIRIAAAIDRGELAELEAGFTRDIVQALAILGLILLAGFALQIGSGLRPMDRLRGDVAAIRTGKRDRLSDSAPAEVTPLVEEVNALLDAKDADMKRARDRAADLAHGLKTPLTALAGDIDRLRMKGEGQIADRLETIAARMHRHVERELARARRRHDTRYAPVEIQPTVCGIVAVLQQMPHGGALQIETRIDEGLTVPIDPDDLNEIIGNLAENAVRHASSRILISATENDGKIAISIEDDGPGLSADERARVVDRGVRLDRSGRGAGLGLAIVQDILSEYGGDLTLGESDLGGLAARASLPLRSGGMQSVQFR
jgi:signal transduction histidine kinase